MCYTCTNYSVKNLVCSCSQKVEVLQLFIIFFSFGSDNNKLRILTLYISLKGGKDASNIYFHGSHIIYWCTGVDQEDYARLMQHAGIQNEDR